jgi:hypothetical protein
MEIKGHLELHIQGKEVELPVTFEFDEDESNIQITSCHIKTVLAEESLFEVLDPAQYEHLRMQAIDHIAYLADMAQAHEEDRGDWLMESRRDNRE